jgi:hypothetical protein
MGIPIFFLVSEYLFRLFQWSGYISRLDTIKESINRQKMPLQIYVIKENKKLALEIAQTIRFVFLRDDLSHYRNCRQVCGLL